MLEVLKQDICPVHYRKNGIKKSNGKLSLRTNKDKAICNTWGLYYEVSLLAYHTKFEKTFDPYYER